MRTDEDPRRRAARAGSHQCKQHASCEFLSEGTTNVRGVYVRKGLGARGWALRRKGLRAFSALSPQPLALPRTAGALVSGRLRRPDRALVRLGPGRETLVHKLLQTLAAVRLGRIEVALRVGGDAVDRVELPGLTPAVAEAGELGERRAIEHVDLLVGAVGQVHVLLCPVLREGDVPHRAVTAGRLQD